MGARQSPHKAKRASRHPEKSAAGLCATRKLRYEFIEAHRDQYPVTIMCYALGLTTSGYYSWRGRPTCCRAQANLELLNEIRIIYRLSRGVYGSRKIHQALQKRGKQCDRKTLARRMSVHGIVAKRQRSFKRTTVQHPSRQAAEKHLAQRFRASRPNQVWLADITYISSQEGWLYPAAVTDLYSRRIIGCIMSNRMPEELTLSALKMATMKRMPAHCKLMHHSAPKGYPGSQYTSKNYQKLLESYGIQVSMSSAGNCYDNAPMESIFSLLKTELIHHESYKTRQEARIRLFDYMGVFYNRQRIHSAIDYQTPTDYESF